MSFNYRKAVAFLAIHFTILSFVGCQSEAEVSYVSSHGPHGGHNLEISQAVPYSLEFTPDETAGKIIVYVYENSGKAPLAIPVDQISATFEFVGSSFDSTFYADPRNNDPPGCSSRFSIKFSDLPQQLMNVSEFNITLSYIVGEQTITALLQHKNDHSHYYNHD